MDQVLVFEQNLIFLLDYWTLGGSNLFNFSGEDLKPNIMLVQGVT